jgi:hypothetical protein
VIVRNMRTTNFNQSDWVQGLAGFAEAELSFERVAASSYDARFGAGGSHTTGTAFSPSATANISF